MIATTNTVLEQNAQPDVSIIVAIYNAELWLNECLHSLAQQSLRSLEVILVLDAATDNSLSICERFVARYPDRFKLYQLEYNQGVSAARNFGIANARGRYLGFVDADDWAAPDMFRDLLTRVEADNGQWARCNMRSFQISRSDSQPLHLPQPYEDTYVCNKLFKTSAIQQLSLWFYPNVIFEDEPFVYIFRMTFGAPLSCHAEQYWYRLNPLGACRTQTKSHFNLMDKQAMLCRFMADAEQRKLLQDHKQLLLECLTNHALSALYYPICHADRHMFFRFIADLIERYQLRPEATGQLSHQPSYAISRFFKFMKWPQLLPALTTWCRFRSRLNLLSKAY